MAYDNLASRPTIFKRGYEYPQWTDEQMQLAFIVGAQACREMMARFVEQGGDTATAASIRANWCPSWSLADPGAPKHVETDPFDTLNDVGDAIVAKANGGAGEP